LKFLFDLRNKKEIAYGIFLADEYVGNIGVHKISEENKSAEIGYWLSQKYCRQGYMTEAIKLLEEELFEGFGLNQYKKSLKDKKKKTTIRIGEELGKYKAGEIYEAGSYSGRLWDIKIRIKTVACLNFEELERLNISNQSIVALRRRGTFF